MLIQKIKLKGILLMAEKTATAAEAQKAVTARKPGNEVLARRLQAVQEAGNLTPKAQRGFDRLAASINQ